MSEAYEAIRKAALLRPNPWADEHPRCDNFGPSPIRGLYEHFYQPRKRISLEVPRGHGKSAVLNVMKKLTYCDTVSLRTLCVTDEMLADSVLPPLRGYDVVGSEYDFMRGITTYRLKEKVGENMNENNEVKTVERIQYKVLFGVGQEGYTENTALLTFDAKQAHARHAKLVSIQESLRKLGVKANTTLQTRASRRCSLEAVGVGGAAGPGCRVRGHAREGA